MKGHFIRFFEEFECSQIMGETLLRIYDALGEKQIDNIIKIYPSEKELDFAQLSSFVDEIANKAGFSIYTIRLFALICLSEKLREFYKENGLPENVFKDTIKNIIYDSEQCKNIYGVIGVTEWDSYQSVLRLKRFALGRLEFEIGIFDKEFYEQDSEVLRKGDHIVKVYAPFTGKPLYQGECEAAYFYARTFFAHYFSDIFNKGKIAYQFCQWDSDKEIHKVVDSEFFFEKIPCEMKLEYTAEDIEKDVRALGIKEGDTLLVHSSFKALGKIKGGAKTLLNTLLKVLGENGTLVFPAFSYRYVTNEAPYFHLQKTQSCVGYLPEYFRTQFEGVRRSCHLTHSCCAIGRHADFLLNGHENDEVMVGKNSPVVKLTDLDGKILFLGCCLHSNTLMHGVEEVVLPPYCYFNAFSAEYIVDDGKNQQKRALKRTTFAETGTLQRYARVWDLLDKTEKKKGYILDAKSYVLSAKAVWEKGIAKMSQEPFFFVDSAMENK